MVLGCRGLLHVSDEAGVAKVLVSAGTGVDCGVETEVFRASNLVSHWELIWRVK